jgi:cytochrome bd-type quinol oxidase subunit 2
MAQALFIVMRWLHFSSIATLIGGIIFARLVMTRAAAGLPAETRGALAEKAAAAFRPLVAASIAGLVLSGVYNILSNPGHSVQYHMFLGIKLLLVMHVFAVSWLIVQPNNQRRGRMMTGALISGLIIIAISAYLRHNF